MGLPSIGITTDLKDKSNTIEVSYSKAIVQHGGVPILIPTLLENSRLVLKNLTDRIDGLLIPGSRDMDPTYYGEKPLPSFINPVSKERTEVEFLVLEYALKRGIPVLGICGGMQFINVFFGGSLYQDISLFPSNAIEHKDGASHEIQVIEETALHKIVKRNRFIVKSYHHQSVKTVGDGLTVNAHSTDGMVEGIEGEKGTVLGVQWHPELEESHISSSIFRSFIDLSKCVM